MVNHRRLSPYRRPRRSLAAVAGLLAATTVAAVAVQVAVAGYGPPTPGNPLPGGFVSVIASTSIGPAGGMLVARRGHTTFRLVVPPKVLHRRFQFTITRTKQSRLHKVIPKGMRQVASFGLLVNRASGDRKPVRGWFSRTAARMTIVDRAIVPQSKLWAWSINRHRFVPYPVSTRSGLATTKVRRSSEFLLLSPKG